MLFIKFARSSIDRLAASVRTLPDGPFQGGNLHAALAIAGWDIGHLAAELDVDAARIESYAQYGRAYLGAHDRGRLKRFFASRGIFEIWLPGVDVVLSIRGRLLWSARQDEALSLARRLIAHADRVTGR
ncbi:hypothetical protein [Phenylobacterium sp. SCN 70-31]|mgnify:CR=1 FL=1|uniref:hypothetical protein n=1 Tax=Phenylobacterium sp. SCN 70-31 TaxID=1660129 RepID=UPI00086DAE0B|nr:hypothetical protein [Phenylobacterium sp. SCN 70-31]ODT87796.1 MAG: hypothetical protein ABS78_10560 [Phenylobacterium sp. SCN 70-31]